MVTAEKVMVKDQGLVEMKAVFASMDTSLATDAFLNMTEF